MPKGTMLIGTTKDRKGTMPRGTMPRGTTKNKIGVNMTHLSNKPDKNRWKINSWNIQRPPIKVTTRPNIHCHWTMQQNMRIWFLDSSTETTVHREIWNSTSNISLLSWKSGNPNPPQEDLDPWRNIQPPNKAPTIPQTVHYCTLWQTFIITHHKL